MRSKLVGQFFVTNSATAVSLLLSIYLARLLSPAEIGIFSITSVLVSFVHVFRDFGVVSFIRSQKELTPEILRSAMAVMMTTSWAVATILFLISPYAAIYFKQPGIRDAMRVLAIGFFFIPFGSITQAVFGREMQVTKPAIVTAVSVVVYAGSCITLAHLGFSYMSLAWANLINIIVSGICYTILRPPNIPWLPSYKGWQKVVNFGGGTILTNSIKMIDTALPDLFLGRFSGPQLVGYFSRANSTVNMMNNIAGPTVHFAALPYLAKMHHSGNGLAAEITRIVTYLTGVIWPVLMAIALLAPDVIKFLYGSAWLDCAPIIPLLCITCAIQLMFSVLQPALLGMGRPYLTSLPIALSVVTKFVVAMIFFNGTLLSFAKAFVVGEFISIPVYLILAQYFLGLSVKGWIKSIWKSMAVTIAVFVTLKLANPMIIGFDYVVVRLIFAALFVVPVWVGAILLFRHPISEEFRRLTYWISNNVKREITKP